MEKKLFKIFGGDTYCSLAIRMFCIMSFVLVMFFLLIVSVIITYGIGLIPIFMFILFILELDKPEWYADLQQKCKKPKHLR